MDERAPLPHDGEVVGTDVSRLAKMPVALARLRRVDGRWIVEDASERFEALTGVGSGPLPAGSLVLDAERLEAGCARTEAEDEEVLLEVGLRSAAGTRPYRLALRAADAGGGVWASLTPLARSGETATAAHFETIVQESPDIIAMIDRDLRHRFVNRAVEAASGLSVADFEGKSHDEMGMPDDLVRYFQSVYREVFATGQEGRKVFEFPDEKGGVRTYESRVVPLLEPDGSIEVLLSYARDVTEQKANEETRLGLERKLQETQRLESLGLLAGGIAHDFNNLLTSILGTASLARAQLKGSAQARTAGESLAQIELTCVKASDLCAQMLAYAGRGRSITEPLDLGALLQETRELLGASVSKDVEFELDLPQSVAAVEVDRAQMQQVAMNLLLNAAESMSGRGTVRVAVSEVEGSEVDWGGAVLAPEPADGRLVQVAVRDRGVGMDEATLARIFEPFFTTKFAGRGLGLAATLGILRQHGGGLAVTSEPGAGTTFRLFFHASERPSQPGHARVSEPTPMTPARVLLVDDEETVRGAAGRMLEALGHTVVGVGDGVEALARYDAANGDFDLLVLDLTMPGMDGIATLERFRQRAPALPVVLMSGYTEEDVRGRLRDERTAFLHKPFRFEQLEGALRSAME
ncbi:MAG: hypothetical protein CMN31_24745 [Sandaracinus sp.]|nr:hypothetical protein [Myxococcales bacterium]MAT29489.1 hypothetical protein [Sandaracinus sp.]MBJ74499.1 hypothetical protein [Sandaracinus sp.]